MTPEMIDRINQLAKKQRTDGLTAEETAEQALLRRQYIDHIKAQVRSQLDSVAQPAHGADCSCGCGHKH